MNMMQLTEALYRLVARIDDDPFINDNRLKEHAYLLRQEIKAVHPDADNWLPSRADENRTANG